MLLLSKNLKILWPIVGFPSIFVMNILIFS